MIATDMPLLRTAWAVVAVRAAGRATLQARFRMCLTTYLATSWAGAAAQGVRPHNVAMTCATTCASISKMPLPVCKRRSRYRPLCRADRAMGQAQRAGQSHKHVQPVRGWARFALNRDRLL